MRLRQASLVTLLILISSSWVGTTCAQTRRRVSRTKRTPSVKNEPLTEIQKAGINELLDGAKKLEITYQYEPNRYYDESSALAARGSEVESMLPDGKVKNTVSLMIRAYADAGYLYSAIYPHRETEREKNRREMIEALEKLQNHERGIYNAETYAETEARDRNSRIASILRSYGVENLSPYEARQYIFVRANLGRRLLEALLPKIPIAPPKPNTPNMDAPDQPKGK